MCVCVCDKLPQFTRKYRTSVNRGGKRKTKVSCYHTGQHSMIPARHVPYTSIATAESRVQGTVNAIRQVSAAPVCVNVKVDVLTTIIPDRLDSATLVFMFINQTFILHLA